MDRKAKQRESPTPLCDIKPFSPMPSTTAAEFRATVRKNVITQIDYKPGAFPTDVIATTLAANSQPGLRKPWLLVLKAFSFQALTDVSLSVTHLSRPVRCQYIFSSTL